MDLEQSSEIAGWIFLDPDGSHIAYTEDPGYRDEWLDEVKAGDWGVDVRVEAWDEDDNTVAVLWPEADHG